jgi:hypothetical protein
MAFGSKIDHRARLVLRQQLRQQSAVTNIALHKNVARIALQAGQIVQVARIGELVEVDNRLVVACQPVEDEVGANKACAASDKNHGV